MYKRITLFFIVVSIFSCDSDNVFAEFKSISNGWEKNEKVDFLFQTPDTVSPYNIYINLRNNQSYPFSNLHLIVNLTLPNNEIVSDTLEYKMAEPDGKWLGEGFSSVKENKLWYKENYMFTSMGNCKVSVEQAMRKNGDVEGLDVLDGVTDIGLTVERAKN